MPSEPEHNKDSILIEYSRSQDVYLLLEVEIPVQQTISANFVRFVAAIFRFWNSY